VPFVAENNMSLIDIATSMRELRRRYDNAQPIAHRVLSRQFPQALWMGNPQRNEVALTFDDGPDAKDTPALLDVLSRHGARATFFNCGTQFVANPHLGVAMANAGHQIALHGYFHKPFLHHALDPFVRPLIDLQHMIAEVTGRPAGKIIDVRPPYGVFTPPVLNTLAQHHFRTVMWSVVPFHWRLNFNESLAVVDRGLMPGAIIILHEGMHAGPRVVDLADAVIRHVRNAGLTFVTIDEMWNNRGSKI
jgi:peptidoglycan/xylan/chitin deacetylase (PgdA/CDA1 family)